MKRRRLWTGSVRSTTGVIGNMEVEPLIVIPVFIHDFLCIHPFNDGNGRMSRLLTHTAALPQRILCGQVYLAGG